MSANLIGVISDTHGLLRPEAVDALRGVEAILHAGDIGKPEILAELSCIAPVKAVRGNNDHGDWTVSVPETLSVNFNGVGVYMLHDLKQLMIDPAEEGFDVVVTGHSHKPFVEWRGGVLFLNPGSAGPRRFKLPVSLAFLNIRSGVAVGEIVNLL